MGTSRLYGQPSAARNMDWLRDPFVYIVVADYFTKPTPVKLSQRLIDSLVLRYKYGLLGFAVIEIEFAAFRFGDGQRAFRNFDTPHYLSNIRLRLEGESSSHESTFLSKRLVCPRC
jgi:hypothetical protein